VQDLGLASASRSARTKINLIGLDLVVGGCALVVAGALRPAGEDRRLVSFIMLAALGVWLGRARLYSSRFITRRSDEVRRILDATMLAAATVGVLCFVFGLEVSRQWLGGSTVLAAVFLSSEREVVRAHYDRLRRSGRMRRRVLMVGGNEEARQLCLMFGKEPELGYEVAWTVDPADAEDARALAQRVLETAEEFAVSGVVIAATAVEAGFSNRLIRDLIDAGLHVELTSTLSDIEPSRLTVRPLGRFPVVYIEPVTRTGWRAGAKRVFDVVLAAGGLVALAPLWLVLVTMIRLDSPGPVLFRQRRVGRHGVGFDLFKFRTMVVDAEVSLEDLRHADQGAGPLFKMRDDPRVTRVGSWLRRSSLDELPQLWNVVRGDMSLVGPRPALETEMADWGEDLFGRLRVKPGITGMWQVSGRSGTSFEEYTRLDLYYVDNWSLFVDLTVLLRTVPAVLRRDGAY
jgi:exopolysaccharide biosynthesis polyprenyl glycosylphosphotransferase